LHVETGLPRTRKNPGSGWAADDFRPAAPGRLDGAPGPGNSLSRLHFPGGGRMGGWTESPTAPVMIEPRTSGRDHGLQTGPGEDRTHAPEDTADYSIDREKGVIGRAGNPATAGGAAPGRSAISVHRGTWRPRHLGAGARTRLQVEFRLGWAATTAVAGKGYGVQPPANAVSPPPGPGHRGRGSVPPAESTRRREDDQGKPQPGRSRERVAHVPIGSCPGPFPPRASRQSPPSVRLEDIKPAP